MTRRAFLLSLILVLAGVFCFAQESGLRINEFQASNLGTIKDDDGLFSDWIELYNPTAASINLAGWSLTDDASVPKKWVFPDVSLGAGGYLVVFASGNDRRIPGQPLHVGFKLSASGEYLGLNSPTGQVVSVFNPFPEQETDRSYGYYSSAWLTFRSPTPGKLNTDSSVFRYPVPVFSRQRGLYTQPFELTIRCPMSDAAVYYTTDGSAPSPSNGTFYTKPLIVTGTTVLRAIAIGLLPNALKTGDSPIASHTFLFPEQVVQQNNTPAGYPANWGKYSTISGYAIADYEMDPVLMAEPVYAAKVKTALTELPIISLTTNKENFFSSAKDSVTGGIYYWVGSPAGSDRTGRGWERPVSFEYFFASDTVSLQADCGIELHGGHSRVPEKCPKHSFKLVFKNEYGPSRLNFPLFGKENAPDINAFNLRAGFGNTWVHQEPTEQKLGVYCRDEWTKLTQSRMGHLSTHFTHAHLFINGIYWGLFNPSEKPDEEFCESYLGGKKEEYDIIEVDEITGNNVYASAGTLDAWDRLMALLVTPADPASFQRILGNNADGTPNPAFDPLLDMDNFIDYMILNYYGGNSDWDYHNWIAYRNRLTPNKGFQFLCWDSEHMLKNVNANLAPTVKPKSHVYILQQLKLNPNFARMWGDRLQKHCFNGGSLTPEVAAQTCVDALAPIENSIYAESARWGDYRRDVHPWKAGAELYRKDTQFETQKKALFETFFPKRTDVFVGQMKTAGLFPTVSAPLFKVNGSVVLKDTLEQVDQLSMAVASGSVYFTKNDIDPVKWANDGTGVVAESAQLYVAAFSPDKSMTIKARALYQGAWSAMNEKMFMVREPIVGLNSEVQLVAQISVVNAPNPFVNQTTFRYSVPFDAQVRLEMFDVSGRLVSVLVNERMEAGTYEKLYDGSALTRGVYVCRFNVSGSFQHQHVFKISKW